MSGIGGVLSSERGTRVKTANAWNIHPQRKLRARTHRCMCLRKKAISGERRKGTTRNSDKLALASTLMCSERAHARRLVYSSARSRRMGKRMKSSLDGRENGMKDTPFSFACAG